MNAKAALFNSLIQSKGSFALSDEQDLYQVVGNSIFPTKEEDYYFFKEIWPVIKADYMNWITSCTKDGLIFVRLMEQTLSFNEFLSNLHNDNFLRKQRVKMYEQCYKLSNLAERTDYKLLKTLYQEKGLQLYEREFQTNSASYFVEYCNQYYSKLGYTILDGKVVNENSLFVLARKGILPLTPVTFNMAVLPWDLNASIGMNEFSQKYHKYGWSKEQLASALNEDQPLSKHELIHLYRTRMGTDGYIDWSQVKKYRYISKDNLRIIMEETFGVAEDVSLGLSYTDLISNLKKMSRESLKIAENAREVLNNASGYILGQLYTKAAYFLRSGAEYVDQSFWYPNLSGDIRLMYKGKLIPNYLIPVDWKSFLWACERSDEIGVGYFIMIAQRLKLWKFIKFQETVLDGRTICYKINETLDKLSS